MRQEWSPEDLIGSWTLVGKDWQRVGNKTGATRLGFGLCLKFFELEARFPRGPQEFPTSVVSYMAGQLKVDPGEFAAYPHLMRPTEATGLANFGGSRPGGARLHLVDGVAGPRPRKPAGWTPARDS